jgi:hypothetical protein
MLQLFLSIALAQICPTGNLKACQDFLKKNYAKPDDANFRKLYEQVCSENKTFSCLKITVRGDVSEVMKEKASERPKASLFVVKNYEETFIYILDAKKKN